MKRKKQYWFRSSRFQLERDEEFEVNPGHFGKQLSEWLNQQLIDRGYETELIAEDFCRAIICSRKGALQWIGCGSVLVGSDDETGDIDPFDPFDIDPEEIVWTAFAEVEIPFYDIAAHLKKLTGQIKINELRRKLATDLFNILDESNDVNFCDAKWKI